MQKKYSRIKNPITLYFHRMDFESSYYHKARSLPNGLFLSQNFEVIEKEAKTLKRNVWQVELLDKYVTKLQNDFYTTLNNCPLIKIKLMVQYS